MATAKDFVIALRVINLRGKQLIIYFGKIRGMLESGDRLATREGLIENIIRRTRRRQSRRK